MHNPVAFDIEYRKHLRQIAWVNENNVQFSRPVPPSAATAKTTNTCGACSAKALPRVGGAAGTEGSF
jgi:hypothetical protein